MNIPDPVRLSRIRFPALAAILMTVFILFFALDAWAAPRAEIRTIKAAVGNLYSQPSEKSSVLDILKQGDQLMIVAREAEWYIARLTDNRLGWVHQRIFTPSDTETALPDQPETPGKAEKKVDADAGLPAGLFQAVLRTNAGRVRENPSLASNIILVLSKGDIVSVMEESEGWYFIRLADGQTGWAHQSLFTRELPQQIMDIRVETLPGGGEKVIFVLNSFFHPNTFALEEENIPKVVCDFPDTRLSQGIGQTIPVNGKFVQQIRTGIHDTAAPKVRVVIDLAVNRRYNVEPVLYRNLNQYTLTFKAQAAD